MPTPIMPARRRRINMLHRNAAMLFRLEDRFGRIDQRQSAAIAA
jgi:hypothetical protein